MEIPKIYPAMAAVMKDVKAIGKTEKNSQQNFKFRGIDNVMNELHEIFARHGVIPVPYVVDYKVTEKATQRGSIMYVTHATMDFHFICGEDGSEIIARTIGEAMDTADKSMNKAMSIALKYALLQTLLIPTEEVKDPDAVTPEETRNFSIAELAAKASEIGRSDLAELLSELAAAKTVQDVAEVYKSHVEFQTNEYKKYFTQRKNEVLRSA